ncbi:MAG: hypothetical protein J6I66_03435 [Lachnospiraceae bacterium]|nr:hypothetical protein [Lachnospiraceae bacterium]
MKKIVITRKKKFAGAMMPYWIVYQKTKAEFMSEFGLEGDACNMSEAGFPIARLDVEELDRIGTRIMNGQTIELELADDISGMFVSTMDGYLSNEINADEYISSEKTVVINTKGGFKDLSHPVIE